MSLLSVKKVDYSMQNQSRCTLIDASLGQRMHRDSIFAGSPVL